MSTEQRIDLGHNHVGVLVTPDGDPCPTGMHVEHLTPDGKPCTGWIRFDLPGNEWVSADGRWQVESWEPLTVSPSLLCACGDHGFVRSGAWVPA